MKKLKIALLVAAALIAVGGVTVYLFTIGPFGTPVLVKVNDEKIPVSRFQKELAKIDPASRDLAREDPGKLLEVIINRTLLLQQAKKEGVAASKVGSAKPPVAGQDTETATIMAYLEKKIAALPPVPAEEIDQIYEVYKERMGGRNKEQAAPLIRRMLEQQRQGEAIGTLIEDLRQKAKIDVNQEELKKLTVVAPGLETQSEADFHKALSGGKPMVVDFGSNKCIPCRQLRPVLQKIRQNYGGKLTVLIIDIRNNQKLASEYQIQVIPTVIFFDAMGKEVLRHQGFMSEEKVKEQLAKMGIA